MTLSTTNSNRSFLTSEVTSLVVEPARALSIATQITTGISSNSHELRVPILTEDPSAEWTGEGQEITISDAAVDEAVATFDKISGLTIVTNELANDSSPAAADMVGEGLARDIARKIDAAFFGSKGTNTLQPAGLEDLNGTNLISVADEWANIDPFLEAEFAAASADAQLTAWVANPNDAKALSMIKEGTGSNRNLLQPDPTAPTNRTISGIPLWTTKAVTQGIVWGIPMQYAIIAMRQNATLDIDKSAFFTSDRTAIRATMRVGFLFTNPAGIQKIQLQ